MATRQKLSNMMNKYMKELPNFSRYSLDELAMSKYNKKFKDLTNDELIILDKVYWTSSVITKL